MRARNTETRWGWVAQLLHWTTAALIVLQLGLAAYILSVDDLVRRFEADQIHKSWGAVIFCVALLHGAFALGLVGLLIVHVGGTLKHYFAGRDDVLMRMLP